MPEESQFLDYVRRIARQRKLSRKTENAYVNHIRHFIEFVGARHLREIAPAEISAFFGYLETEARYAAATRRQAVCALTFLYQNILGGDLSRGGVRLKRPAARRGGAAAAQFPVFFTPDEAKAVLAQMSGAARLAAALIYGAGLRLSEALNLRVGDIEFERGEIVVRDARTNRRSRTTVLPKTITEPLLRHLREVRFLYEDDCLLGGGGGAAAADVERHWRGQFVFPSPKLTTGAGGGRERRHLAESTVQKAIGAALARARIIKKANCQTFRYSFAARLFERNTNVRIIQTLLGHKNLKTTMSYINFRAAPCRVQSPLDY